MQRILSGLIALLILFTSSTTYAEREDAPAANGRDGPAFLCRRNDTNAALTDADNDWVDCSADSAGRIKVVTSSGSASTSMSEATPAPQVTVVAASVPTAIGTPQYVDATAKCKTFVQNGTNVDVDAALNGAAVNHHRVPAGSEWYEDWCANGQKFSGSIQVNIPNAAATPSTGSVVIGGSSR